MHDDVAVGEASAVVEARDTEEAQKVRVWHTAPWVHGCAAGVAGALIGGVDGYLAATRTGLDPLSNAETAAACALSSGLTGSAGLLAGAVLGASYWGLTRKVPPRALAHGLFSRKGLLASGLSLALALGAILTYGHIRSIEWHAVDWRGPILVLVGLGLYVGQLAMVRGKRRALAAVALTMTVALVAVLGWSTAGEAGDEGLVRVGTEAPLSRYLLPPSRRLFDHDADGFPTALCRLDCDCDDANADVFPGAIDAPGNGLDEDCNGADLSLEELQRFERLLARAPKTPAPQPAGSPDDPASPPDADAATAVLPKAGAPSRPPNILFIVIDTLRADHLGFYGYTRPTSPRLDELATHAVVFDQARATGPQTRFSVPAMVVGKYFTELDRTPSEWPRIGDSEQLTAEDLSEAGYLTAAFHSVGYFNELYGMNQGFAHYDATAINKRHPIQRSASSDYVTDQVLAYVDSEEFKQPEAPFFLWTYFGDPHSAYLFHDGFPKFGPSRPDAYDCEIAFTDHHVGRMLDGLRERGLLENTVIVLTSDHGEGLDPEKDHGHRYHGPTLYDEVMRVPLMVIGPGYSPARVHTPVSLIDLAPTFRDLAGLEPSSQHRGVSLVPYFEGERPEHPPVFFEKHKEDALPQKGMVLWPYKVILVMPYNRYRIYDLENDPAEQTDIRSKLPPAQVEELVGLLNYWATQVLVPMEPIDRP